MMAFLRGGTVECHGIVNMVNQFKVEKAKKSRSRKVPLLPRFGLVIEFGGKKFSYRHAPIFETMVNLIDRGPSFSNFQKIILEQLYEISLPTVSKKKTVNVKAKTVSSRPKKLKK